MAISPGTTEGDILDAYEDCGISYEQALAMLTKPYPIGLGVPIEYAITALNNTTRNCGDPIPTPPAEVIPSDSNGMGGSTPVLQSQSTIPDNFFGFLMLIGGV